MAGVQGMGSPNKAMKVDQASDMNMDIPVQAMAVPSSQTQMPTQEAPPARPSLDEIFGSAEPAAKPSLDEIFGAPQPAPAPEEFSTDLPSNEDRFGVLAGKSGLLKAALDPIGTIRRGLTEDQGFGELPARARASFQVTDKEIQKSLELDFGKENVRKKDGDIEYKGKDGKWRVWDDGITVEDFTVDQLRPVIEETPASVATYLTAPLAIPTGGAATAAARAAGGFVGQGVGDLMQKLTGVERDEDRSALLEYGLSTVLAPAAGAMADYATKSIAKKAAAVEAKKLMSPDQLYKEEIAGIKEGLEKVKELGGMENLPGTNTPVMLYHLNPSNNDARQLTEAASKLNGYAQMEEHLVQGFDKSSRNFLETLGNINPDNMASGQKFKSYVEEAIKKEGQAIGAVRQGLIDAAGNGELPVPKLKSKVEAFASELGFKIGGETNIPGLKSYLVDEMGYSRQAADLVINKTNKMLEKVTNKEGRMTAKELVGAYEEMNGLYKNIMAGGQETSPLLRQKIGEFRRFFADELVDKSEVIIGKEAKSSYLSNLKNYKDLVTASDEFSGLLDKNNLASHSLSKAIFSKGSSGLDAAESAKTLLKDRPDLLNDVKGSFIQETIAKSQNKLGKTDWVKFNKTVNNPELKPVIESMFGKDAAAGFKAYETVAQAIENGNVGAANSPSRALFLKNMALSGNSVLAAGNAAMESLKQVDADSAFMQIVSKEGIDNFIKTAPKNSKPFLKQILSGMQTLAQRSAQVGQIPIRRTGKNMSKEGANQKNQNEGN